jgi:undecaprenyl diphosphate synthase
MPRGMGHRAGAEVVRRVVSTAAEAGVETLSLYAFSSDNWKRPAAEVELLMRLFQAHLRSEATRLTEEGIRLEVIGRRDRLPASLLKAIVAAESRTANGSRMTLRIAVDYSGRYEITRRFTGLPLQRPTVDVDLLIRTGGERRLSDFLLWESAYAELVFTDTLWPDLTPEEFLGHLADFGRRERRFGGLPGRASA